MFSVFLMTQNFLQFSCFSKKRFKNYLSNFFVSMHRLLGGVRWQVSFKGVAFCCCFLRAFWRENSKPEVTHRQTGNEFQVPVDWHLSIWESSWWHFEVCCFFRAFWREKSKAEVRQRQTGNGFSAYWHLFIWESSWWWAVNPASHLRHTNGRAWAWAWVMICWNLKKVNVSLLPIYYCQRTF